MIDISEAAKQLVSNVVVGMLVVAVVVGILMVAISRDGKE